MLDEDDNYYQEPPILDEEYPVMLLEELITSAEPVYANCSFQTPFGKVNGRFRKIRRGMHWCVDVIAVVCYPFGRGIFRWMIEWLKQQNICCIHVDSIHSEVLWKCLPRYGFKVTPKDELSMYWCRLAENCPSCHLIRNQRPYQ